MTSEPIQHAECVLDKRCPKCRGYTTYNGNYYCLECDWALAERADEQPWLRSLIRARQRQGRDTTWEEQYLTADLFGDVDGPVPDDPQHCFNCGNNLPCPTHIDGGGADA